MNIFFDDRCLILLKPGDLFNGHVLVPGSAEEIKQIIIDFDSDTSYSCLALSSPDYKKLKREFKSIFTIVQAAGGVVMNEEGEILFIHRRGKWDFPKGKIEPNNKERKKKEGGQRRKGERRRWKEENQKSEAIREVKEETGIAEVRIIKKIKSTYHVFHDGGILMLKKNHWFEMFAPKDQLLVPQVEEDIRYVRWFRPEELPVVLENTFGSLKEMIEKYCSSSLPLP